MFSHEKGKSHHVIANNVDAALEVLNIGYEPDIFLWRVHIVEKIKTQLNKKANKCKNYENVGDIDICIKNAAWNSMQKSINCTVQGEQLIWQTNLKIQNIFLFHNFEGMLEFVPKNVTIEECTDDDAATQVLDAFKKAIVLKQQVRF